ncbi:MAG: T9SS type A sorting domain-containing protein, partial [Flavisolibacter sp.]
ANGVHTITSTLPIGLLVYGFGSFDSYGYLGGQSFSAVATVTTVQLTPANGSSAVGSNQCFDALVRDQFNDPVSGVRVDFAVTGVNPGSSFVFTNASGIAQFCYTGTNAGADVITANVGGINDASNWTWNPVSTNVYYSKAAGDLHNVLTWGVNPDGSGANPPDFTAGKTFNLANRPGIYTMTGNWTVGGVLNNPAASQLRINGFTLSIASLTGPGTLSGSATSSLIVAGTEGGDAGTLNFTTGARMLNNFTIDRTGAAASATLGTALDILSVLTATNGTLNTGGFLTLKSSASNTARVAPVAVTANINGSVTVERYIPARRAWRILSAPIMGTQTIKQSWQENAAANTNPNPGFGTNITGGPVFGSTANGFDLNPGAQSSIQSYTGTGWTALPNTNVNTVGTRALMLFVRGHRGTTLGLNTVPPTITTLRAKGPLNIGDRVYLVPASGFAAIPNPYASPINFATITRSNVANNFYLWDPKMGGTYGVGAYVNVSFNGVGYDVTPASVSPESQYIQSGQGFIVASTGVAGSLTIKESDKSATPATNVFRTVNSSGFRITLQAINEDHSTAVLDEAYNSYSSMYSSDIDAFDAPKLSNIEENLAILSKDKMLIVERRPIVSDNETIYLKLWNTTTRNYVFEFNPENMGSKGLYAVLHDKYLRTVTPIDLNAISQVYFTVNGDEASKNTDRFKVVFTKNKPGAVKPRSWLTIYPNPVSGSTVNVEFSNMDKGTYMVTLVNDLGQVIYNKPVFHAGGSIIQQIKLNHNLARGVYQIQVSGSGEKIATKIVSH